jgi:hypothetical protein
MVQNVNWWSEIVRSDNSLYAEQNYAFLDRELKKVWEPLIYFIRKVTFYELEELQLKRFRFKKKIKLIFNFLPLRHLV